MNKKINSFLTIVILLCLIFSFPAFAETVMYDYDGLHRLTRVERDRTITIYNYDDLGNRTSMVVTLKHEVPTALFSASPASGIHPLTVSFTDQSTGDITSWLWSFGDGETSTEQNPTHTYNTAETFTVSLTVTGPGGSDTKTMPDYILVQEDNDPPTAIIDYITPNPAQVGEDVTFSGHGEALDGSITGYSWESNIDGWLSGLSSFTTSSLTEGTHTISFKVQDDEGIWSEAVTQALVVGAIPTEIIIDIDNRDAETSQTETWKVSGATDPCGADSVYSRDGATFTWHFTPSQSGIYEVSMWWTEWPSRSTSVPVDIEHSGGTTTVYINQQQNGGQWNSLDDYLFESGSSYNVTIIAQPGPSSTCADAVRFNFIQSNDSPTAIIDYITPNPAQVGEDVTFSGHGEALDGSITGYSWESNIDGWLSGLSSFTTSSLTEGTHTISFKVQDDEGIWSEAVTQALVVGAIPTEIIIDIDNRDAET